MDENLDEYESLEEWEQEAWNYAEEEYTYFENAVAYEEEEIEELWVYYDMLLEEWDEQEEERLLIEDEEETRLANQAWEEAKDTFDDEEELYNEYYSEYQMWY